ncbi:DUF3987 domain-containing protein, partial [Burkholderia cenocepacia]|uniref:DUF3987 domain-containing protein n=1 Tax=Burkholderia cenocepacia TaxID=95486 RepID=UPI002117A82C
RSFNRPQHTKFLTRPGSIIARQPRITVNLMVQDAVLDVYQQDRGAVARGSGFWARYLVGAPGRVRNFVC